MHKLLISLLMATLWSSNVYADGFSASVGTDYSTGKYGCVLCTVCWQL